MDNTSERTVTLRGFRAPDRDELFRAARAAELERLAEKGYEQLGALTRLDNGLWADESGRLWQQDSGVPAGGRSIDHYAFAIDGRLQPIWLIRPSAGPRTVEQLEVHQQRAAKRAAESQKERQARLKELRKTAVPISFGHFEPSARMTLAEAGQRITAAGGKIELRGGRVVVSLPPSATSGYGRSSLLPAARMLYAAEAVVAECLGRKEPLPPVEVTPNGVPL
jgi:hypothetical protein